MMMPPSILIVDPNREQGSAMKQLLQSAGFEVRLVSTFVEGRQLLASDAPNVLITSLRLGAYNGLHLVLRSRLQQPNCAAIVTTEFADPVLEAEATQQQAAFLLRPFDDSVLLKTIDRCVSRNSVVGS